MRKHLGIRYVSHRFLEANILFKLYNTYCTALTCTNWKVLMSHLSKVKQYLNQYGIQVNATYSSPVVHALLRSMSVLLQMLAANIVSFRNQFWVDWYASTIYTTYQPFLLVFKAHKVKGHQKHCQEVVYFPTLHLLEVNFVFGKMLCVIFLRAQQVVKRATPNQQWKTPNNRNYFLWKMREKMRFTIHIRSTQLFLGKSRWKNQRFLILRGSPWKV